ncbi:MAG: hypothetical protein ABJB32_04755 [Verrucomicrobiota bacterium]
MGLPAAERSLSGRSLPESFSEKISHSNEVLYALDASRDYDPDPNLEKIHVPLSAINSADDLINPPELGILERDIKRRRMADRRRRRPEKGGAESWSRHCKRMTRCGKIRYSRLTVNGERTEKIPATEMAAA